VSGERDYHAHCAEKHTLVSSAPLLPPCPEKSSFVNATSVPKARCTASSADTYDIAFLVQCAVKNSGVFTRANLAFYELVSYGSRKSLRLQISRVLFCRA